MKDADKDIGQLIDELAQLRQRIAELEASEAERKRVEEVLRISGAKYRALIDNANEIIVVVQDNISKFSNLKAVEVTGYSQEELTSRPFVEFIHPDDRQIAIENYSRRLIGDESTHVAPVRILDKLGKVRWMDFSWSTLTWEGRPALLYLINDITEWKKVEEALAESEAKYRELTESITDIFFALDEDLRYIYWNKASEELTGVLAKDALGKHLYDLFPDTEATRRAQSAYRRALTTKKPQHLINNFPIDGRDLVFEINAYPTTNGLCVYVRDITERKKLEEALRESEQWYRLIFDNAPIGIGFTSLEGKVITLNKAMESITGYSAEEFNRINVADMYVDKADRGVLLQELSQLGTVIDYSIRLKRKDGTQYYALVTCKLATIGDKKFVQTILHDVTERKRAEEALRESEERYRSLVELSPEAIFVASEGKHVFINSAGLKLFGASSPDQIIGKPLMDFIHPNYREIVAQRIHNALETGMASPTVEEKFLRLDGTEIDVEVRAAPLIYQGKPAMQAVVRDISERKQAEESLRLSEQNFRDSIENSPLGIRIVNEDGKTLYANRAFLDIYGYSSFKQLEAVPRKQRYTPESYAEHRKRVRDRKMGKHVPTNYEIGIVRKDGQVRHLAVSRGEVLWNGEKQFQVVYQEITERKAREQEYKAIIRTTIDGFWQADMQGHFLDVNEAYCHLTGYSRNELLNMSISDIEAIETSREIAKRIRKIKEVGYDRFETRHQRKDGEIVDVEISVNYLPIDSGRMFVFIRDITQRKRAEESLGASEERYRLLAENVRDVIWSTDMDFRFTYVSPSVKYLGDRNAEEVMSMFLGQLLTPSSQELAMKTFAEELVMANVTPLDPTRSRTLEVELVRRDGSTLWAELKVNFMRGPDGRPVGILGVMRDITERKKAEEERREFEQKAQLASRLASVGELAAGVAHEINNPLTGVIGYAELLMQEDVPEHIKSDLEIIHSGAKRVADIVKGLLKFARQTKPERTVVDINQVIEVCLRLRAYETETSNIKVTTKLAPDLPLTIADPGQLQQVFLNLLINAETEMKLAHGKGKLTIKTQRADNNIRICFKDDGPGVAKENLEKIFDPFFTTREVGKGTGLGLSICHGIITEHEGRIWAESKPGKGSTFIVELPVVAEKRRPTKRLKATPKTKAAARTKILVVDDEPVVRRLLSQILEEEGYKVETTDDGRDALNKIKSHRYSLIMLDVKLPGMSGSQLYAHIREIGLSLARRVVFITGDVMGADTEAFLTKAGAPFITKPFEVGQLKAEIRSLLVSSRPKGTAKSNFKSKIRSQKSKAKI
jgi:PAS domain S-box-containing protein